MTESGVRNEGSEQRNERQGTLILPLKFQSCNFFFTIKRRAWIVSAAVLLLLLPRAGRAELVDRIAAAVNNEVITASELALAVALNARFGNAGTDHKTLESETLDGMITRRLLIQEARRLRFVEVSDQELAAEMEKLVKRFGSDKAFHDFLNGLDATPEELARMLGERLLVERFVEKKVGLFVRISRDEAQNFFESHAADYRGKRFQDVQKTIIARLTEQKIGQHLDQYVAELRAKADIRIYPAQGNGQQAPTGPPSSRRTQERKEETR
jgi:hypothetical protein